MSEKICFVALGSYPIFSSNKNLTYIGGAELQQVLVGTELAKRGFLISFITYNEEGSQLANKLLPYITGALEEIEKGIPYERPAKSHDITIERLKEIINEEAAQAK